MPATQSCYICPRPDHFCSSIAVDIFSASLKTFSQRFFQKVYYYCICNACLLKQQYKILKYKNNLKYLLACSLFSLWRNTNYCLLINFKDHPASSVPRFPPLTYISMRARNQKLMQKESTVKFFRSSRCPMNPRGVLWVYIERPLNQWHVLRINSMSYENIGLPVDQSNVLWINETVYCMTKYFFCNGP